MNDAHSGGKHPGRTTRAAVMALILCLWPIVASLNMSRTLLGKFYVPAIAVGSIVFLRLAVSAFRSAVAGARSHSKRDFRGEVDDNDLRMLEKYCQGAGNDLTADQFRYFAMSVLSPPLLRRRLTDEYTPNKRTLHKKVTVDFDLKDRLALSGTGRTGSATHQALPSELFLALTLPKKGQLYDGLVIRDANGANLPHLSQREYRLLAARTLRILLRSAFAHRRRLPPEALAAERLGLMEIIRFTQSGRQPRESTDSYRARLGRHANNRTAALNAILGLEEKKGDPRYLSLATQLVARLSELFAVVVVYAPKRSRFVLSYERTIIPEFEHTERFLRRFLDRLRTALGARPVYLTVDARNAVTCHTYHLLIVTPPELYLGEFDISPITETANTNVSGQGQPMLEPYWRVRGRRGQNYFHLYTRALEADDPGQLRVDAKFFETPPGSIVHAAIAAIANFLVILAVSVLFAMIGNAGEIDTQVAAFLLAIPGLAAAWIGYDSRPSALLEGTLGARLSSIATFVLSLSASTALLFHVSGAWRLHFSQIFLFGRADLFWTVLTSIAFVHVVLVSAVYGTGVVYFERLSRKQVGNSAVMTAN